jgi:hypothetical protein
MAGRQRIRRPVAGKRVKGVGKSGGNRGRESELILAGDDETLWGMSVTADKLAEALALPLEDRAFFARQLIASLDPVADADAEMEWGEVIDRRYREIEEGRFECRPVTETMREVRGRLDASRGSTG